MQTKYSKRTLRLVFPFVLLFLVGACASKVKVDSTMNMPSQSGLALKSIAVGNFSGDRYGVKGSILSAKIKSELIGQGFTSVDNNSPYILVGEILPSKVERKSWSEKHEGKKETWYSYHASVQQSLSVSFAVILGQKTLTSGSENFSYKKEKDSGENSTKAKSKLLTDAEVVDILIGKAAEYLTKQISPYRAKVNLNYLSGDDDNLDLGIEYVKKSRFEQAYSIFDQVAQNSTNMQDQAKAIHNQGLVKLMQGKHSDAYELMSKANLIDPSNLDILDSMLEVEDYKVKSDLHKKQTGQ
jgi:tetratricopeptide (TPR) repeat protein